MGYATAAGYAEAVNEGAVSLESAVSAHLRSNCFPPVHPDFHPFAVEAIEAMNAGEEGRELFLPNGKVVLACDAIEQLHLEAFLDMGEMDW